MARLPLMAPVLNACFKGRHQLLFHKAFILVLTFFVYMTYHLSRRPISVAKGVWYRNCSIPINDHKLIPDTNSSNWCDWAPFDSTDAQFLLGWLDTGYLFAYAFGMFISGHIAERMSLRYFLTGGMILSGIFTAAVGLADFFEIHQYSFFIILMVVGGFFQSTGWPAVVAVVANWHGKERRGFIMGVWNTHTSVGNILGALVAGAFIDNIWGWSFIAPGIIIAVMGVIAFLFLIEYPTDIGFDSPDIPKSVLSVPSGDDIVDEPILSEQPPISLRGAVMIPGVIEYSLALFFCKLVSYTFLFWLPFYINNTSHLSDQEATYISTLFDVGGVIGGVVIGLLSDVTGSSAIVSFIFLIIAAPVIYIYNAYVAVSQTLRTVLMMITAFFTNAPYSLITTAISAELGTHPSLKGNSKALATVASIIDGTGTIGAAIGPLLTGIINTSNSQDESRWSIVFLMLAGSEIVSALCLLRLVYKDIVVCCQRRNHSYQLIAGGSRPASPEFGSVNNEQNGYIWNKYR